MRFFFIILSLGFSTMASGFIKPVLPLWYPLIPANELKNKKLHSLIFDNQPLACYHKFNNTYIVHSDVCPHQGASLSKKGWINRNNNLQCGYHGFEFCDGNFCKIPDPIKNPKYFKSRIHLNLFPTLKKSDFLFFSPNEFNISNIPDIFYPPEESDSNFRQIDGFKIIDSNYMTVCENLLDMLHISYVHSFGNRQSPIPFDIKSKRLGNLSFRTEFLYSPNENTISNKIGKASKVIVQNEYHLPTNTITRVFAGDVIKTVFTRSVPINENKTLLYWKIYRNFWNDPFLNWFSYIGDFITKFLMEKTINEDIDMLKNVYDEFREGNLITKYDVTIHNFRNDVKNFFNTSKI